MLAPISWSVAIIIFMDFRGFLFCYFGRVGTTNSKRIPAQNWNIERSFEHDHLLYNVHANTLDCIRSSYEKRKIPSEMEVAPRYTMLVHCLVYTIFTVYKQEILFKMLNTA